MKLYLSSKADKQLKKLPAKMHSVLIQRINKLTKNTIPQGSKKLVNRPGWRIRVGDYRILYTINKKKKEIVILSVAHRKDAYR